MYRNRARAIKRPPNVSPLKKRPVPVAPEEPQERKRIILPSLNDPPIEEFDDDDSEINASERLGVDGHDSQSKPEEVRGTTELYKKGVDEHDPQSKLEEAQGTTEFNKKDGEDYSVEDDEDDADNEINGLERLVMGECDSQFEQEEVRGTTEFYEKVGDNYVAEGVEDDEEEEGDGDDYGVEDGEEDEGDGGDYGVEDDEGNKSDGVDVTEDEEMNGQQEEEEENGGEEDEHVVIDGGKEEHCNVTRERRRGKELEIFIGGLSKDATEEDLKKVFCEVGELTEVRLMKNPLTQRNRGYAFLRFATIGQARRAVKELKHTTINGRQCEVSPSLDNDILFIGNIKKTWTKEIFKEKLAEYGVNEFDDLHLVEDFKNEGLNRGYAFLYFPSHSDALDACRLLQRRNAVFGINRTAKVTFADAFNEPVEIMEQVTKIFIDGLPPSWDENRVREHLQKFGKIEKVELAKNMLTAKRKDFGYVTFYSHDDAVTCAESINNTLLGDGEEKVKVKATLSRPLQTVRSRKQVRGGHSIGHSLDRGGQSSRAHSVSRMDSLRLAGRKDHDVQNRRTYGGGFKRPFSPRDGHPVAGVASDRVGSRRHLPPLERSLGRRSPASTKVNLSSKRDHVRHNEPFSRSSDGITTERRSTYRDDYPSRRSEYFDSPPRTSRGANRRTPLCEEESYSRRIERPSYQENYNHDYSSFSAAKRPHYAVDDLHPRHGRQPRARYDYYGGSTAALQQYGESDYHDGEPTRHERGSYLGYEGSSRSSAGHSYGKDDLRTSNTRYSQVLGGGERKCDASRLCYGNDGKD